MWELETLYGGYIIIITTTVAAIVTITILIITRRRHKLLTAAKLQNGGNTQKAITENNATQKSAAKSKSNEFHTKGMDSNGNMAATCDSKTKSVTMSPKSGRSRKKRKKNPVTQSFNGPRRYSQSLQSVQEECRDKEVEDDGDDNYMSYTGQTHNNPLRSEDLASTSNTQQQDTTTDETTQVVSEVMISSSDKNEVQTNEIGRTFVYQNKLEENATTLRDHEKNHTDKVTYETSSTKRNSPKKAKNKSYEGEKLANNITEDRINLNESDLFAAQNSLHISADSSHLHTAEDAIPRPDCLSLPSVKYDSRKVTKCGATRKDKKQDSANVSNDVLPSAHIPNRSSVGDRSRRSENAQTEHSPDSGFISLTSSPETPSENCTRTLRGEEATTERPPDTNTVPRNHETRTEKPKMNHNKGTKVGKQLFSEDATATTTLEPINVQNSSGDASLNSMADLKFTHKPPLIEKQDLAENTKGTVLINGVVSCNVLKDNTTAWDYSKDTLAPDHQLTPKRPNPNPSSLTDETEMHSAALTERLGKRENHARQYDDLGTSLTKPTAATLDGVSSQHQSVAEDPICTMGSVSSESIQSRPLTGNWSNTYTKIEPVKTKALDHKSQLSYTEPVTAKSRDHTPQIHHTEPVTAKSRDHTPQIHHTEPVTAKSRDHTPQMHHTEPVTAKSRDHTPQIHHTELVTVKSRDHTPQLHHPGPKNDEPLDDTEPMNDEPLDETPQMPHTEPMNDESLDDMPQMSHTEPAKDKPVVSTVNTKQIKTTKSKKADLKIGVKPYVDQRPQYDTSKISHAKSVQPTSLDDKPFVSHMKSTRVATHSDILPINFHSKPKPTDELYMAKPDIVTSVDHGISTKMQNDEAIGEHNGIVECENSPEEVPRRSANPLPDVIQESVEPTNYETEKKSADVTINPNEVKTQPEETCTGEESSKHERIHAKNQLSPAKGQYSSFISFNEKKTGIQTSEKSARKKSIGDAAVASQPTNKVPSQALQTTAKSGSKKVEMREVLGSGFNKIPEAHARKTNNEYEVGEYDACAMTEIPDTSSKALSSKPEQLMAPEATATGGPKMHSYGNAITTLDTEISSTTDEAKVSLMPHTTDEMVEKLRPLTEEEAKAIPMAQTTKDLGSKRKALGTEETNLTPMSQTTNEMEIGPTAPLPGKIKVTTISHTTENTEVKAPALVTEGTKVAQMSQTKKQMEVNAKTMLTGEAKTTPMSQTTEEIGVKPKLVSGDTLVIPLSKTTEIALVKSKALVAEEAEVIQISQSREEEVKAKAMVTEEAAVLQTAIDPKVKPKALLPIETKATQILQSRKEIEAKPTEKESNVLPIAHAKEEVEVKPQALATGDAKVISVSKTTEEAQVKAKALVVEVENVTLTSRRTEDREVKPKELKVVPKDLMAKVAMMAPISQVKEEAQNEPKALRPGEVTMTAMSETMEEAEVKPQALVTREAMVTPSSQRPDDKEVKQKTPKVVPMSHSTKEMDFNIKALGPEEVKVTQMSQTTEGAEVKPKALGAEEAMVTKMTKTKKETDVKPKAVVATEATVKPISQSTDEETEVEAKELVTRETKVTPMTLTTEVNPKALMTSLPKETIPDLTIMHNSQTNDDVISTMENSCLDDASWPPKMSHATNAMVFDQASMLDDQKNIESNSSIEIQSGNSNKTGLSEERMKTNSQHGDTAVNPGAQTKNDNEQRASNVGKVTDTVIDDKPMLPANPTNTPVEFMTGTSIKSCDAISRNESNGFDTLVQQTQAIMDIKSTSPNELTLTEKSKIDLKNTSEIDITALMALSMNDTDMEAEVHLSGESGRELQESNDGKSDVNTTHTVERQTASDRSETAEYNDKTATTEKVLLKKTTGFMKMKNLFKSKKPKDENSQKTTITNPEEKKEKKKSKFRELFVKKKKTDVNSTKANDKPTEETTDSDPLATPKTKPRVAEKIKLSFSRKKVENMRNKPQNIEHKTEEKEEVDDDIEKDAQLQQLAIINDSLEDESKLISYSSEDLHGYTKAGGNLYDESSGVFTGTMSNLDSISDNTILELDLKRANTVRAQYLRLACQALKGEDYACFCVNAGTKWNYYAVVSSHAWPRSLRLGKCTYLSIKLPVTDQHLDGTIPKLILQNTTQNCRSRAKHLWRHLTKYLQTQNLGVLVLSNEDNNRWGHSLPTTGQWASMEVAKFLYFTWLVV